MIDTVLAKKMIDRANADNLSENHEIRMTALSFEENTKGFFGNPQTVDVRKFMGSYARAKLAWTKYSGEPLV